MGTANRIAPLGESYLELVTVVDDVGRTSMKVHIEAWARRFRTHHREKVTDATFTFVAVDDFGRPRPVISK